MHRELTYQMPFERLLKLSRSASRKAYSSSWYLFLLLLAAYLGAIVGLAVFDSAVTRWQDARGLPWFSAFLLVLVIFVAAFWVLRRYGLRQMKGRANYGGTVRLRQDEGGLRFMTDDIEYYVKWSGISQMLLEHDGFAVSHGNLFFLVPDSAFSDITERNGLIRDVFARLGEEARARSKKFMRPVLDATPGMART
jgi:hypothetical protein